MNSSPPRETKAQEGREQTMFQIAAAMFAAFFVLLIAALVFISDEGRFGRVRTLIDIVAPIVGIIVGFYFNKVATEPRIESAERREEDANVKKDGFQQMAGRASKALDKLINAAEPFASGAPRGAQRDADGGASGDPQRLREAIELARKTESGIDA